MTAHETDEERSVRLDLIDDLVADGADREHLKSLTPEQLARFCKTALQIARGELRRVTLSDGCGVLVDGDCTHTDDEIRAAMGGPMTTQLSFDDYRQELLRDKHAAMKQLGYWDCQHCGRRVSTQPAHAHLRTRRHNGWNHTRCEEAQL